MGDDIFHVIDGCASPDALFDLLFGYFDDRGFGGVCYLTPPGPTGPYVGFNRGMPEPWMAHYKANSLHLHDPIPGVAFQLAHPVRLSEILERLPSLNADERAFIEGFKNSEMTEGLAIPTFGPFGRPGLVGATMLKHPRALDELDISLANAVAQQVHHRMALLQMDEPLPVLSSREREILKWMGKGKSNLDIAAILRIAGPTVNTYVQRIYAKMRVRDRVSCIAKAMALHYV